MHSAFILVVFFIVMHCSCYSEWKSDAYVEIGGPTVGVELHHSRPVPQRISFYFPVANSIDNETDYYTRDRTVVQTAVLRVGPTEVDIGASSLVVQDWTPFNATLSGDFQVHSSRVRATVSYRFFPQEESGFVQNWRLECDDCSAGLRFEVALDLSLRACQTYDILTNATFSTDPKTSTVYAQFHDEQAGGADLYVASAADVPRVVSHDDLKARFVWETGSGGGGGGGGVLHAVLVIGSVGAGDAVAASRRVVPIWESLARTYEESVLSIGADVPVKTGDAMIDASVKRAVEVMATNRHVLDGVLVPMPCPAEYNFFFTHDAMMADMAAVFWDVDRVHRDLKFIVDHGNQTEHVIAHAYYFARGAYQTELAVPDSWNHAWFAMVTARYLRASGNAKFVSESLLPFVRVSVELLLSNVDETTGALQRHQPDWWDIGHHVEIRTYLTQLTIAAVESLSYLCSALPTASVCAELLQSGKLIEMVTVATRATEAMTTFLWQSDGQWGPFFYDTLYGKRDYHIYSGPLLAAHLGCDLPDASFAVGMASTVASKLLLENLGIMTAWPLDWSDPNVIKEFGFVGNEAANVGLYFNGGIWAHGNAWFALARTAAGDIAGAVTFLKQSMTIAGVESGENGQPAFYEYRDSRTKGLSLTGKVDKPQFLWAASWMVYVARELQGPHGGSSWNIPILPRAGWEGGESVVMWNGEKIVVRVSGSGPIPLQYVYSSLGEYPSAVIPEELHRGGTIDVEMGQAASSPLILCATSEVVRVRMAEDSLNVTLRAFVGYSSRFVVLLPLHRSVVVRGGQARIVKQTESTAAAAVEIHLVHASSAESVVVDVTPRNSEFVSSSVQVGLIPVSLETCRAV